MTDLKLDFGPVRKCDCAAYNQDECICGAWDDHGDLRPYAEEIVRLRGVLTFIAENGGFNQEGMSCNGSWCAEQARRALE